MPLLALRAFAAVGREGSVKAAASLLGVTPGAVSQQIRQLEIRLGTALFIRGNREITLTRAGLRLLPEVAGGFDRIEQALERFDRRRRNARTSVRIGTTASFAATWLVPRLGRFSARHPRIEVQVLTSADLVPVGQGAASVDMAIRHGLGVYPGLESERLLQPRLIPVGSPSLLANGAPIRRPEDCLRYPLLQDADGMDWALWLCALGVADPDRLARRGNSFSDDYLLVRAAMAGQGLALVRDTYAAEEIAAGRLVRALDIPWPAAFAYWLVTRPGAGAHSSGIAALRTWLLDEATEAARK
ncbi:MAG TPA: LysR substrate-binding domain-containing protein [Acidiphilium sp.]